MHSDGLRFRLLPVLHRYVLKDLSGTLILSFLFVLGLMTLFLLLEGVRRAGVESGFLVALAPTLLPFGLKYALPVSLLLAVTFTFSRMASDNEILALRAAGSSLWPLAAPVLLAGMLLSFLLLFVTMAWLPGAEVARRDAFRHAGLNVLQNLPAGENQFQFGRVRLAYGDARNGVMRDVFLSEAREDGLKLKITAKEARWRFDRGDQALHMELRHSQWTWMGEGEGAEQKVVPEVVPFRLDLENLFPSRPRRVQDYSLSEILGLRAFLRELPADGSLPFRWGRRDLEFELHSRFADSFSPLVMALLGMPLGVLVRQRGKLAAFFVGFLPVLAFYYPLTFVGMGVGVHGGVPPALAAWAADALVGAAGAWLTWRMVFR